MRKISEVNRWDEELKAMYKDLAVISSDLMSQAKATYISAEAIKCYPDGPELDKVKDDVNCLREAMLVYRNRYNQVRSDILNYLEENSGNYVSSWATPEDGDILVRKAIRSLYNK